VREFKYNRSAASAIRQIRERGYADAYVGEASSPPHAGAARRRTYGRRPVALVGIKFDPGRKNIDVPKFEPL